MNLEQQLQYLQQVVTDQNITIEALYRALESKGVITEQDIAKKAAEISAEVRKN